MKTLELNLWDIEMLLMCIGYTHDEIINCEKEGCLTRFKSEELEDMYRILLNWRASLYTEMERAYQKEREEK